MAAKPAGAADYGSWRSVPAGSIKGNRSFLSKDTPISETIDGLLGIMPVGARNVTYIPADAMDTISKGNVSDKELYKLPGVQTFSHGPYLDDWSKVPDEIAMKYNTAPQNLKK